MRGEEEKGGMEDRHDVQTERKRRMSMRVCKKFPIIVDNSFGATLKQKHS